METLIRVIGQYAQWIYALCGFTALYNIYKTWQIRAERRQAVFTLERQKVVDDLYKILFTSLLLLTTMGVTYFVSDVLAEAMGIERPPRSVAGNFGSGVPSGAQNGATSDTESLADGDSENLEDSGQTAATEEDGGAGDGTSDTSTTISDTTSSNAAGQSSDNPEGVIDDGSALTQNDTTADGSTTAPEANTEVNVAAFPTATQPLPTPTFTYAPPPPPAPPTIVPTAIPAISSPLCVDARARINSPGNGSIVSGSFNIVGSATHEQFQFYKVEYAEGASTDQPFVYLAGGNNPISGGVLATIDSTIWPNGTWTIRIVVVDQTGNFPPPCNVTITVSN